MKHRKSIVLVQEGGDGTGNQGLAELPQWYELLACCPACHHVSKLDRYALARRYGNGLLVAAVGPKLRCGKCGNRVGNRVGLRTMSRD